MEPNNLRGISIIAAEAINPAKSRGVAIPAVRADALLLTRSLSGTFSSAGSVPIRAPITIDDDGSVTETSDASGYSKEIDSGSDDGFESVSENELEDVVRVLGEESVGENGDVSDFSGGSVVFRPLAGEEASVNYSSLEEEESEVGDGMKAKVVVPRASLSLDDDDDDVLGGDEDTSLLPRAPCDEVEDRTLQFGHLGMVDEPQCSDSVLTDVHEAVEMKVTDRLEDGLISFRNLDVQDLSFVFPSGGSNDFMVENEASISSDGSSKQLIEEGVVHTTIIEEDGAGSIHESDSLMKPGDVELRERGMSVLSEGSCSVTGELVSTEEDMVQLNLSDDASVSFETGLGVAPGDCSEFLVERQGNAVDEDKGLDEAFSKLDEQGVGQESTSMESDNKIEVGSACEADEVMIQGEGSVGSGSRESEDEDTGSMIGEEAIELTESACSAVRKLEEPEIGMSCESSQVSPTLDSETTSEGNAVGADKGLDGTFSKIVEQRVGQESISKESDNKIDNGIASEADISMIQGEGSIGLGSRESDDEDTGSMIGEANEVTENACSAVGKLEKPECEDKPEIGMISECSQVTPTVDYETTRNLDVTQRIDVVVSGCDSSNQKADQETENEGTQESEDIDRKLSLPDEDRASSLRSSFEMANENVENGEQLQISEQVNEQVNFQVDGEPNGISVGIEETSLISCVAPNDVTENETQIARLIHNETCMELDEYEGTSDTKKKLSESSVQNYNENLSSDNSPQLISGRVKERVEKTKLLKEKLQSIIRGLDLCNESSAVTEVESRQSLVVEEHHTTLEPDDVYDGTKTKLPEQELPLGLDFSINVLVIGKTGVGKSATVNSIFGETKSSVGAFEVTTKSASYVVGKVGGVLIRILDTPGLVSSATEERYNQEVLMSIKKGMRRFPVDVILYIDRLDENPDVRLLRTITSFLGSSIWRSAIVVLTHADSSSCKDFIAQRSSLMHQSIRQAVPELSCVERSKMPGVVLAENNMRSVCGNKSSTCPDWRLNLVILCCSVKMRWKSGSLPKQKTIVEKPDGFGSSQLHSFTLFCSLWKVLLLGSDQGHVCNSLDDLEEKRRRLLESYPEILWDEQSQECVEQERLAVKNQEGDDEKESVRRRRRGRLGFQATKRLGIYLDTCDLHAGFSMGSRKVEEEEGKMVVRMRGSLSVLGLAHVLMSVITCVYGRKDI